MRVEIRQPLFIYLGIDLEKSEDISVVSILDEILSHYEGHEEIYQGFDIDCILMDGVCHEKLKGQLFYKLNNHLVPTNFYNGILIQIDRSCKLPVLRLNKIDKNNIFHEVS